LRARNGKYFKKFKNKLPRSKLTRYSGTSPEEFVSLSHSSVQQAGRYSASRNKAYMPVLVCRQGGEGQGFLWFGEEKARFFWQKASFLPASSRVTKGQGIRRGEIKINGLWIINYPII